MKTVSSRLPARVLALFIALALGVSLQAIESGADAPGFEARGLDGKIYSSSDYAGKVIVLEWTHYGCPFVGKLYRSGKLPEMQRRFDGRGVIWFNVASGGSADTERLTSHEFAGKRHVKAVLLDGDGSLAKAFGARTAPHIFVIDGDGQIAYEGAVDDNRSASVDSANEGRNYLADALEAVLAGGQPEVRAAKPYGCAIKYPEAAAPTGSTAR